MTCWPPWLPSPTCARRRPHGPCVRRRAGSTTPGPWPIRSVPTVRRAPAARGSTLRSDRRRPVPAAVARHGCQACRTPALGIQPRTTQTIAVPAPPVADLSTTEHHPATDRGHHRGVADPQTSAGRADRRTPCARPNRPTRSCAAASPRTGARERQRRRALVADQNDDTPTTADEEVVATEPAADAADTPVADPPDEETAEPEASAEAGP